MVLSNAMTVEIITLFVAGFVSSFACTSVGGFGLLLVPLLILFNVPTASAVATTRMGIFAGTATSIGAFHRSKNINFRIGIPVVVLSIIGAYIGSKMILAVPDTLFQKMLGIFILCILILTLCRKNMGIENNKTSSWMQGIGYVLLLFTAGLSAFFSGGTGVLGRTFLMIFFGQTFLESAGTRKLQNAAVGIASISVFLFSDVIHWSYAITLMIAIGSGSYFGAHYAIKKGNEWVRKIFIVLLVVLAIKMFIL